MPLILRLILRLVGVAFFCLALTVGWVMLDAHRDVAAQTAASADRVAHELENLFWRRSCGARACAGTKFCRSPIGKR